MSIKRVVTAASVGAFGLIFLWHLIAQKEALRCIKSIKDKATDMDLEVTISANPVTNVVSVKFDVPYDLDTHGLLLLMGTAVFETALKPAIQKEIERKLNTKARGLVDIYAMIVSYKTEVSIQPVSRETTQKAQDLTEERESERRSEKRRAEERKRKEKDDYISSYVVIENLQVSQGRNLGRTVKGLFGTIVNNGDKALKEVRIRVYYLDRFARAIGEKEFSPVLVISRRDPPLRAGYRKDFGYNIEDDAPSGWSGEVEVEIVDIEFLEE